jgi:hypothetical protein
VGIVLVASARVWVRLGALAFAIGLLESTLLFADIGPNFVCLDPAALQTVHGGPS